MGGRIFICFFLAVVSASFAQPAFINYTTENGLPSSETYDILQDSKGYIWIATDRGVSRYNGYTFENFSTANGLEDNVVYNLFEDRFHRIWFTSRSGKFCYYDYEEAKIVSYPYNDTISKYLKQHRATRQLFVTEKSELVIGDVISGTFIITHKGQCKPITPKVHYKESDVQFLVDATSSDKVMYSARGLSYGRATLNYEVFWKGKKRDSLFLLSRRIEDALNITAFVRKGKSVMACLSGYLIEQNSAGALSVNLLNDVVYRFFEDAEERLYACMKSGLRVYEKGASFFSENYTEYFKGEAVAMAIQDQEGGLWVSTLTRGIYYLPKYSIHVQKVGALPDAFSPSRILKSEEGVYAAFDRKQIFCINAAGNPVDSFPVSANGITALIKIGKQFIYSCGGIFLREEGKLPVRLHPTEKEKYALAYGNCFLAKDSILIAGGNAFINEYSTRASFPQITFTRFEGKRIRKLFLHNNKIYAGTTNGLFIYQNRQLIAMTENMNDEITGIEQLNGDMVISTSGKGVFLLKKNETVHITMQQGLLSNNINAIEVSGSTLWLATNSGLNELTFNTDTFSSKMYTSLNGLPSNEVKAICSFADALWFTTPKGLYRLIQQNNKPNNVHIPLYISEVIAGDKLFAGKLLNQTPAFDYNTGIRIYFAALSYRQLGKAVYRYRLIGSDTSWQSTLNTSIEFAFLNNGNYRFELCVKDEWGQWTAPVSFSFNVKTPFWKAWWFMALVFLFVAGALYAGFRYRLYQIRQVALEKERAMLYQHQALVAQINPHFVFNSLNSVYAFILTEEKRTAAKYLSEFSRLMRITLENSRADMVTMSKDLEALQLYVQMEELRFKNKFTFSVELNKDVDADCIQIPPMLIQPFVENCIRHAFPESHAAIGKIAVRICFENNLLLCQVEDDGVGLKNASTYKENKKHNSAGIDITRQRLLLHNKKLNLQFYLSYSDNTGNSGTRVKFYLPYKIL